jgi:hypothetical protein
LERPDGNQSAGFSPHIVNFSPSGNIHSKVEATISVASSQPAATTTDEATTTADAMTTSNKPEIEFDSFETVSSSTTANSHTTQATQPVYIEASSTTTSTTNVQTAQPSEHVYIEPSSTTTTSSTTTFTTTNFQTAQPSEHVYIEPSSTTSTTTSSSTTTTTSTTTSTTTTSTSSSTAKRPSNVSGSSNADGFASSSQNFASFVHDKVSKEPSESFAASYSSSISHKKDGDNKDPPLPQSSNTEEEPKPQSYQEDNPGEAEYRVYVETFFVDLLPFNSGHSLKVRNPSEMARAVDTYLLSYFSSSENNSYAKKLSKFDLGCGRTKEKIGSDLKVVLSCDGDAVFKSWPPSKRELADLIHEAFAGGNHAEFLEFMYPTYSHSMHEPEVKISPELNDEVDKNEFQQSLQDKLDELFPQDGATSKDDQSVNLIKQAKKDLIKMKKGGVSRKGRRRFLRSRT